MEIKDVLREFIVTELMMDHHGSLEDHQSLLEGGIIDSLGIMKLVVFVEEKFNIKVSDEELIPANFETINNIKDLLERKGALKKS